MSNTEVTTNKKHAKTSGDKTLRIGTGLPGPGRPKKAVEEQVKNLSVKALKKKYGTLDKAFVSLLESKEPSLIRLVFEYAFGKPEAKVDGVAGIPFSQLNIQIVQSNNNGTIGYTNNQGIPDTSREQQPDSGTAG
ncbi:MAG TPA: hypothetical protein VGE79_15185 [Niastella sp.]